MDLPEILALIEQLPQRSSWERSDIKAAAAKAKVVQLRMALKKGKIVEAAEEQGRKKKF
ncbi:hypothetical protein N0Y54_40980 [Nostoc punctiforme UO1]